MIAPGEGLTQRAQAMAEDSRALDGWGPIESEAAFRDGVQAAIEHALAQRHRELRLCDPHFGFWPLSQEQVLSGLTAFVRLPGRKVILLAQRYDHLRRRHPRFLRWRQDWSHAVSPLCLQETSAQLPALLLADRDRALYLRDPEVWAGRWVTDRVQLRGLHDQFQGWMQAAQPDLAVSVTGL